MRIALTGGIACGKSLLAKYLNGLGVETIDADDIVHELVPADERRRIADEIFRDPAKRRELEARIHPLVRARLAAFASGRTAREDARPPAPQSAFAIRLRQGYGGQEATADRPSTLNPQRLARTLALPTLNPQPSIFRIEIIPLLFECHWEGDYDIILCVSSPRDLQVKRMTSLRGYTEEQAEARLAAQLPVEEKAARSDYVIMNDGSAENLENEARKLVEWLKGRHNG